MSKIFNREVKISSGGLNVNENEIVNSNGRITNATASALAKTAAYTMTASDSGQVTTVTAAGSTVITLPSTVVGYSYTIVNGAEDGVQQLQISPAALDKIVGTGEAGTDNKDRINTLATSKKGDYIKLIGDGADGWYVTEMAGTWAEEA